MSRALTVVSKLIGATAAGVIIYDGLRTAAIGADKIKDNNLQDRLVDQYMAATKMDAESVITNNIKKKTFEWQLGWNWPESIANIRGFFMGLGQSLSLNILPMFLAAGAIIGKKRFGGLNKICAAGLVALGAKRLVVDIWGIGKKGD